MGGVVRRDRALRLVAVLRGGTTSVWWGAKRKGDSPCSSGTLPTVAPADSRALFAHGNRGAFAHRCPSRFQRIFAAPKAGDCLEFTSLHLPQAALRRFPTLAAALL